MSTITLDKVRKGRFGVIKTEDIIRDADTGLLWLPEDITVYAHPDDVFDSTYITMDEREDFAVSKQMFTKPTTHEMTLRDFESSVPTSYDCDTTNHTRPDVTVTRDGDKTVIQFRDVELTGMLRKRYVPAVGDRRYDYPEWVYAKVKCAAEYAGTLLKVEGDKLRDIEDVVRAEGTSGVTEYAVDKIISSIGGRDKVAGGDEAIALIMGRY